MTTKSRSYSDRLAEEVAKVVDGLAANTKTRDQARRHLSAELALYWDARNLDIEGDVLRAGDILHVLPSGDTDSMGNEV